MTDTYNICKCYTLIIFSVIIYLIIYVIKMSNDEDVDIAVAVANASRIYFWGNCRNLENLIKLECGPMPNVMVALPNIGGALCSTPQSLADAHY